MIDTIQIKIPRAEFLIERGSFFCDEDLRNQRDDDRVRQKMTNWEFRQNGKSKNLYIPKFWLEYTSWQPLPDYLVLEFSVPKFLLGTSLYSVSDVHYESLISSVQDFLREIHVRTSIEAIENAIVTQIAYCKNIQLDYICTAYQGIAIFDRLNYVPRSGIKRTSYEDESGYSVKFYNSARSLAIYEKLPEVANHATTKLEADIATQWKKTGIVTTPDQPPIREVIRFELTLQNKKAVNQALRPELGKKACYTLRDVFNQKLAEKLLRDAVDELSNHPAREFIFTPDLSHPLLLSAIRKHAPTRLYQSEMIAIIRGIQEVGIQRYRQRFIDQLTLRTWQTRCSVLKKISMDIDWEHLEKVSERDILRYIMNQFHIEPKHIRPTQLSLIKAEK